MSNEKVKKRTWGYFIIVETNTDFKENWARKIIYTILTHLVSTFTDWDSKAKVKMTYTDIFEEETKYISKYLKID